MMRRYNIGVALMLAMVLVLAHANAMSSWQ